MSKGSKRRPQEVSDEEFEGNWSKIFNKSWYTDIIEVQPINLTKEDMCNLMAEFLGDIDLYEFFNNTSIDECIKKLQNLKTKYDQDGYELIFKCEYIGYDGAINDPNLIRVKKSDEK